MCIIHSGMAYAIHIDIFIIMLLITCRNTWTELQPQCRCEFMRNVWQCEWKWHTGNGMVLYLSTIGLAHTQKYFWYLHQPIASQQKSLYHWWNQYLHNVTNIMLPFIQSLLLFLDLKHSSSLLSFQMKLEASLQLASIPGFRFYVCVCLSDCLCKCVYMSVCVIMIMEICQTPTLGLKR